MWSLPIINKTSNILSWHLWQLLLEQVLHARKQDHGITTAIVGKHSELDETLPLFDHCWFFFFEGYLEPKPNKNVVSQLQLDKTTAVGLDFNQLPRLRPLLPVQHLPPCSDLDHPLLNHRHLPPWVLTLH